MGPHRGHAQAGSGSAVSVSWFFAVPMLPRSRIWTRDLSITLLSISFKLYSTRVIGTTIGFAINLLLASVTLVNNYSLPSRTQVVRGEGIEPYACCNSCSCSCTRLRRHDEPELHLLPVVDVVAGRRHVLHQDLQMQSRHLSGRTKVICTNVHTNPSCFAKFCFLRF